ncbi:hypothetical protein SLOPH_1072 [Spraguea lophii 42_110]|uniref:Uncharacterized protein n=1 Tax=Spraguea lophii (strain 42_110) TaxID=1358809 RepID=S7XRP6_SPRLO|nr:hypothetical protein SLOPH_1072 [Spraguea lophii 42_110]
MKKFSLIKYILLFISVINTNDKHKKVKTIEPNGITENKISNTVNESEKRNTKNFQRGYETISNNTENIERIEQAVDTQSISNKSVIGKNSHVQEDVLDKNELVEENFDDQMNECKKQKGLFKKGKNALCSIVSYALRPLSSISRKLFPSSKEDNQNKEMVICPIKSEEFQLTKNADLGIPIDQIQASENFKEEIYHSISNDAEEDTYHSLSNDVEEDTYYSSPNDLEVKTNICADGNSQIKEKSSFKTSIIPSKYSGCEENKNENTLLDDIQKTCNETENCINPPNQENDQNKDSEQNNKEEKNNIIAKIHNKGMLGYVVDIVMKIISIPFSVCGFLVRKLLYKQDLDDNNKSPGPIPAQDINTPISSPDDACNVALTPPIDKISEENQDADFGFRNYDFESLNGNILKNEEIKNRNKAIKINKKKSLKNRIKNFQKAPNKATVKNDESIKKFIMWISYCVIIIGILVGIFYIGKYVINRI